MHKFFIVNNHHQVYNFLAAYENVKETGFAFT